MRLLVTCILPLAFLCLVATEVHSQTTSGSMSGTVTDPHGAVIPGAKVIATHEPTKRDYGTITTPAGLYVFPTLPAGPYTLTVTQHGFNTNVQTNIEIRVALRNTMDVKLDIGDVAERVEVKAEVPLLETTTAMRGQNLSPQFVASLPIFAGGLRNVDSFVGYMPGVNTWSETSINGSNGRAKEMQVDGGSVISPESGGISLTNVGFEAFQEFKLITSTFNAEHGRLGGGLQLIVTRSGTNAAHGSAFLNVRRDIFKAAGWASNHILGRTPGFRAKERYDEQGGTAGGPVLIPKVYDGRSRTFFYFTYARDNRPSTVTYNTGETLPTTLMRSGNFSEVATIYDPLTASGSTRLPFANNIIPTSRFSSISNKILPYIPAVNRPGVTSNYDFISTVAFYDYIASVKADHSITSNNRISCFMNFHKQVTSGVQYLPGPLSNGLDSSLLPQLYRVNHDWILKPTVLLHTTYAFTQDRIPWTNPLQNGWGSKFGFNLTGDLDATPYINFQTDNLQSYGMNQGKVNNGYQYNRTLHLSEQLTWTRGKHEFKMGWDIRRLATPYYDRGTQNGMYYFSRVQTADPAAQSTTGNAFASFLLGAPNTATQGDSHYTPGSIRYGYHAGFWQDTWRITSRLTLDYGIRYEVPIGWHLQDGNYTTLDPNKPNPGADGLPGALIYAGSGAGRTGQKRLYPTDWTDFGPRVGFAYRLTNKTVIRGGYGIFFQTLGNGGCGCTDGFNGSYTSAGDGINPAFYWDDTRNVPTPYGYKPPPRIDPSFLNYGVVYYQGPKYGYAPHIYNWSFTIQHEFKNWSFETAYVGNRGHGLNSTIYMNQLPAGYLSLRATLTTKITNTTYTVPFASFVAGWGKGATVAQSLRNYPQYGTVVSINSGDGQTWYDALQTKVERRFGALNVMASWVWSKSLGMLTYRQIFLQGSNVQTQDAYNLKDAKTYSYMDIPNFVNIITSYQLPFGKGKRYLGSAGRAMDLVIGGWRIATTQQYRSGGLIEVLSATNQLSSTIFSPLQKANATGYAIKSGVSSGDLDPDNPNIRWFSYGASSPYANAAAYTLGTASIYNTNFRNPWFRQENISISKSFTIWESVRLSYRADAFNIFNRTSFGTVNGTIGSDKFGLPTAPQNGPRVITMGLRLEF
ncbi:MAG: carboxypeptidase regulatory-like domain-containing protein [Acidobacteriales bacterium]|nr:carboxypeptidase regulatory-like domain-containing protein [Terriglobales bacterium]